MPCVIRTGLLIILLAAGCGQPDRLYTSQFFAFGTLIEISLWDVTPDTARRAEARLLTAFQEWHDHWHPWESRDDTAGLAAVNRALARGESAPADSRLRAMIDAARPYYDDSAGLFDPAVGGLVRLWGFDRETAGPVPPPADNIGDWLENRPTFADIHIEDDRISSHNRKVQLDFGGFAKGYALDLAVAELDDLGVEHALVNAGGDMRVMGRPGDRPWRIGIRHPRQSGVLAGVELAGSESLVTSGDYERYFLFGGNRYHHILDPRSGTPADTTVAVSVIHSSAATADAAATALFVAGPDDWPDTARQLGVDCVMLIDSGGRIHLSDCMRGRLDFKFDPVRPLELTP